MQRSIVPFRAWHFAWLGESIERSGPVVSYDMLRQLEQQNSYTGIVDGDVVFCAGTVAQWPTRHTTWALLGAQAPQHTLWVTREVRAGLDKVKGRIELTVRADFTRGQKWAKVLGFRVETPLLEKYGPEGEDHIGYVRIN